MSESGTPTKRGRGRPSVSDEEKKNYTVSFRARGDIKERLEYVAKNSGRSLSEEVEYILSLTLPHVGSAKLTDPFLPSVPDELTNKLRNSYKKMDTYINLMKSINHFILFASMSKADISLLDENTHIQLASFMSHIKQLKTLLNEGMYNSKTDFDNFSREIEIFIDNQKKAKT